MKFELKGPFRENVYNLMRKASYHFLRIAETSSHLSPRPASQGSAKDEQKDELEFARPPRGYPRFHLFVKVGNDAIIFKLHLDQKKPIYKGAPAHAGEYDGETVEKEAERIKQILNNAKN